MPKKVNIFTYSEKGRRKTNQDCIGKSCFCIKGKSVVLLTVADGMGGYRGGDIASKKAVDMFHARMKKHFKESISMEKIKESLKNIYQEINKHIYMESRENRDLADMGTTLTSLVLVDSKYIIANIGDSRAYSVKEEEIFQITEDHSAQAEAEKEGLYTPMEIAKMPYKYALTRNLGNKEQIDVDIFPKKGFFYTDKNEIIMLLTDGVTNKVSELELYEEVLSSRDLKQAAHNIGKLAYQKGSKDNISIALVEIGSLKRNKYLAGRYQSKLKKKARFFRRHIFVFLSLLVFIFIFLLIFIF